MWKVYYEFTNGIRVLATELVFDTGFEAEEWAIRNRDAAFKEWTMFITSKGI